MNFWVIFFTAVLVLVVIVGTVHTLIERGLYAHRRRLHQRPLPPQTSHVRTIPAEQERVS